ncbi:carbonic anhydrase family protein [Muriicola sp.]|uniref:carbonic anhydrase family protein n=1 Tax=Muriicola sp. TaxID=2020856 RepID=UPI003C7625FB
MTKITTYLLTAILAAALVACQNNADQSKSNESQTTNELKPLVEKVLTADEQAALTPDAVIEMLKSGNKRFMSGNLTARDHSAQVRNSTFGQYPKAVILSCLDSRVPVSDVFDRGIGDIFVGRVAGNFVNVDMLGSMEFGCKVAGAKLILVMGHEHCGAVKAAIDDVELGNITAMLTKIKPAVDLVSDFDGEKSSKNEAFVHEVCESNVKNTINEIRINSPILKEMEENGEIKIIGAVYNMSTGEVMFLN